MKKRTKFRLIYSSLSALLAALAVYFIVDYVYIHAPASDENIWTFDAAKGRVKIRSITPGGVSDRAGLNPGDLILAIDGREVHDLKEAQRVLNRHSAGDTLRYTILRGDVRLEKEIRLAYNRTVTNITVLRAVIGFLFLLVGWIVVYKKPLSRIPRLFYYFSLTFFIMLTFAFGAGYGNLRYVLGVIAFLGILLWGPATLHFFLNFPLRAPILNRHPRLIWLIYLPSAAVMAYLTLVDKTKNYLLAVMLALYFAASLALLIASRAKIKNPHERKSITIITWGLILGLIPLVLLALASNLVLNLFDVATIYAVFLAMALVPIAFGYSVMRYGLMDVEIIIRKSLIYSLITGFLIGLYFVIVVWLGGWLAGKIGLAGQWSNLIFLGIVAVAFQPVRNSIQQMVDRRFYRERYRYQKTLLRLSQQLLGLTQTKEILQRVARTLVDAMHVESVAVHLYDQSTDRYPLRHSEGYVSDRNLSWKKEPNGLVSLLLSEKRPFLFYRIEEDEPYQNLPISDKVKLEKNRIVLSVPLFYKDKLIGMMNLGPKKSGQIYNQEDVDLLQTVAGNVAIALINAHLYQEDLRKQRLENEVLMARQIQRRLLPKQDPRLPGFEITGYTRPATLVGGDYFDYIPVSPTRLFVLVGDVAGKGMPAAIYMSKVQGMIHVAAGMYSRPQKLLVDVNRHVYEGIERRYFITMLAALVDGRQRKIILGRAGHMPVLVRRDGKMEFISSRGIGLGLEPGKIFEKNLEEVEVKLRPGDFCLFYSDGLVETRNEAGQFYGEERLAKLFREGDFSSVEEMKKRLLENVLTFQGKQKQTDDITFVIVLAK